jgi:predicted Zn-dependent protease
MMMDQVENSLKTSGRLETDPELNRYIGGIIQRLVPDQFQDIRFYIVKTSHFNASMAPNGCMQVWTGLLLRCQNEAQLAYILGHEIGHYQKRHSLKQWRAARDSSSVLAFFSLVAAGAGAGFVGPMAQLAALAGLFAYSREQEREADEIGFSLMVGAGYEPRAASLIWKDLVQESKAAKNPEEIVFFATHPSSGERIQTLDKNAEDIAERVKSGQRNQAVYLAATKPFRKAWLQDELRKREFAASQVVLSHLSAAGGRSGEIEFFQGELHRQRAEAGDLERARACYEKALGLSDAPPETYRSLGLLQMKKGAKEAARLSFERYLEARPDAGDATMIQSYIEEMKRQ